MRWAFFAPIAIWGVFSVASCARGEPHDFPARAEAEFHRACPADDPVCACTWDEITRKLTYEEYQDAMDRFKEEGHMDPRLTHARTVCREHHHA